MSKNIDVLIVGAGPVGLFCANELHRHGLSFRIIDKKEHISEKSKALGLHIRTLDVLEDTGFIQDVVQQGHAVEGVLLKSKGKVLIDATFNGLESNWHHLIDLPQNQTEAIFYQSLQKKGLDVEWQTELTDLSQSSTEITATIHKTNNEIELCQAKWLIACDGAHSAVRHRLNAEFKGSAYKERWWLADLLVDWSVTDKRMAIYINERGPLACFPMGNKRYRIVMTAPNELGRDPSLEEVIQEFQQRCTDVAKLSHPFWLCEFSIHHRQVQHYRFDKIFLAGDAAHIHSPMGGQGLNTGLQDIYNLVWKLALVEKRRAKPELLDTYEEERFPVGLDVVKKTDRMTRIILLKNPLLVVLRNRLIRFLGSIAKVRHAMAKDIAELSISYAKSSIVYQKGCTKTLKAGSYLPDFNLKNQAGEMLSSKAITQGNQHHLFLFAGLKVKKPSDLITTASQLADKYKGIMQVHLVVLEPIPSVPKAINLLLDEQKKMHLLFNLKKTSLCVVRPDKYIAIMQKPIQKNILPEEFYLLGSLIA